MSEHTKTHKLHLTTTLLTLTVLLFLISKNYICNFELVTLSLLSVFVMLILLIMTFILNYELTTISFMYISVFTLFHFGMTLIFAFQLPIPGAFNFVLHNYSPNIKYIKEAIYLSTLGFISLVLGVYVSKLKVSNCRHSMFTNWNIDADKFKTYLLIVSFTILISSMSYWLYATVGRSGFSIIFGSYEKFLDSTKNSSLSFVYYLIGFSFVLIATVGPGRIARAGIYAFGLFAFIGFPLGLRGEILFPVATAIGITTSDRIKISKIKIFVIVLVLLCLIGGVRVLRQAGIAEYEFSLQDFSPHYALMEMGGQIWSIAEMCSWADYGEPFLRGASYWAPFDRALFHIIPWMDRPDAEDDERLLQLVLERRVSAIGFSPVAEGYRNFGTVGVIVAMFIIGGVLGYMERHASNFSGRVLSAVVLFPLVIHIRNSFTPVPFQIFFGLTVVFALLVKSKIKS